MSLRNLIIRNSTTSYSHMRALLYTIESLPLPILNKLIAGSVQKQPTQIQKKVLLKKIKTLLDFDAQEFADRVYPLSILKPESPLNHFSRWIKILGDSTTSFWRRRQKTTNQFSKEIKNLHEYPDYYQRNFHHQTDGYLSDQSAEFYEHQVELLFRGLADPMRRRLLKPLKSHIEEIAKPQILEIGCGTGAFTENLIKTFPHAHITAVDLSPNYIRYAKKKFIQYKNVDFVLGNAESLVFKSQSFDAVVSVFMHHELPQKIREKVLDESLRLCKPNGFWGFLDSLQLGDDKDLNWALEEFPKTFHEPFFTNYIKNPIKGYLEMGFKERGFEEENHLLSKIIYSKPISQ